MRRTLAFLSLLIFACGGKDSTHRPSFPALSKEPISVRGWIADVEDKSSNGMFRTVETEAARRAATFQQTNMWIDGAPYVSGGVAENGAFVLLDVPPGNVTISFSTPRIPLARLTLTNIPGNADVIVPGMIVKQDGTIAVENPKAIQVRVSAKVPPTPMSVASIAVAPTLVPVNAMMDRHDYLTPPSTQTPVATVK